MANEKRHLGAVLLMTKFVCPATTWEDQELVLLAIVNLEPHCILTGATLLSEEGSGNIILIKFIASYKLKVCFDWVLQDVSMIIDFISRMRGNFPQVHCAGRS